jgi:AraC family transcriptional regulator
MPEHKKRMAAGEACGDRLGKRHRVENAPTVITQLRKNAIMAVSEIRCDDPLPASIGSIEQEDAYLVGLSLPVQGEKACGASAHLLPRCSVLSWWAVDEPTHEYREDDRRTPVRDLRAGDTCLYDLKRDFSVLLDKPYHSLLFYLSREALNAIADDVSARRIGDLNFKPGSGIEDATIFGLGSSVLPALSLPDQANRLFVDHVTLAIGIHVAQTYGGMRPVSRIASGRLAPWQERRAKEIISANLDGVSLADVARECSLSTSHFQRAFRRTVGMAPHKWLMSRRIELAKEKLRDGRLPLSDVALECGFGDQSHLTRVFTRLVGTSPGVWRRLLDE